MPGEAIEISNKPKQVASGRRNARDGDVGVRGRGLPLCMWLQTFLRSGYLHLF